MAETLIIRFPAHTAALAAGALETQDPLASSETDSTTAVSQRSCEWLLADPKGGRLSNVLYAPLAEVAGLAAGRHIVVLVPGSDVLLAELDLPAKNTARLQQMVPFALEEQLAGDIEDMHFAIGKRSSQDKTPVAAVNHRHMQTWIGDLASAGIVADAIYPETLLIPPTSMGATLLIESHAIHIRNASACGTTIEAQPFNECLQLALPADSSVPVTLYVAQAEYENIGATLDAVRERYTDLQIKLLSDGALPLLALQLSRADELFSLQQGQYQQAKVSHSNHSSWRMAASVALAAVLLHAGYQGTQLWRLAKQEKQLNEQIVNAVSIALPSNTSKDAGMARRLMESRLVQLQKGGGASPLLSSLNTLGQAMAQTPGTQIESLAYNNKTMNLRLNAPSVDSLDQLRARAQASGLQSELQGTTPREKTVEGRLQLKSPGV
jgi:general secretion pathway protein L